MGVGLSSMKVIRFTWSDKTHTDMPLWLATLLVWSAITGFNYLVIVTIKVYANLIGSLS
jgi:hypothetical protein